MNWARSWLRRNFDPSEQLSRAIDDFSEALKRDARQFEAGYDRAVARVFLGEVLLRRREDPRAVLNAAITDLDTVLAADRGRAEAYTYRGLAHYYRGLHAGDRGDADLRTALADFAEAVKRDPSMAAKVKGAAEEARKRLGEE
jgi:hypothetical protein